MFVLSAVQTFGARLWFNSGRATACRKFVTVLE